VAKLSNPALAPTDGESLLALPELPIAESFTGRLADVSRDYIEESRRLLEQAHNARASGLAVGERFSDAVDELIRFIVEVTSVRFRQRYARGALQVCAVIAQGGYGRREMNPWSDVDILVAYPGRLSPYVETVNERLMQTLFDAGLQVGWAVRTFRECLAQADEDLTIKTSLLDGRFVAGSRELGAEFTEVVQDTLAGRDIDGFVGLRTEEARERHLSQGSSVFLLEPNVKEGQGGLRDLHNVVWVGRVLRGILSVGELASSGLASEEEQCELLLAQDFLLRVRNALHFIARYKQDKLTFEAQEMIAAQFGYVDNDRHSAVALFMRDYYSHAAMIARSCNDILERLTAPPEPSGIINRLSRRSLREGVDIVAGQLVADETIFERDPLNILTVFCDAQLMDVSLSSATREAVRRSIELFTQEHACSAEAIEAFMSILRANEGVYRTLSEMNRLGVIGRMIPEFGRLFCMVQHDFYHVYTVDEHSLIGIRELERVRAGNFAKESPLLTQIMRECEQPEILFLGMMFHDLGKGYGGDHDEKGAVMVKDIGKRLGLHLDDPRALEFLVRHHLLMSTNAQTRDIDDDDLVSGFVEQVGTFQNLRNLYLLTFADMKAVGPTIWNSWRDHLLGELYLRSVEALETGSVSEQNRQARIKRIRSRVISRAAGEAERARLSAFVSSMPRDYLLANTEDKIIEQWRLYESLGSGLFRSGIAHFPKRGFTELTICTPDQPGLFMRLTGVLSVRGLSISGAKIATSSEDICIDTFRIDHFRSDIDPLDPEVWAAVRADIEHVLADDVDVAELVETAARAKPMPRSERKARKRAIAEVRVDNKVSRKYSVVEVYAADRPGLLFAIADCMHRLGLTVQLAKINTHVNQVLDVFYVCGPDGKKILSAKLEDKLRASILAQVLEPEDAAEAISDTSPVEPVPREPNAE
jgi:[protein-PII] uridylyltransferase